MSVDDRTSSFSQRRLRGLGLIRAPLDDSNQSLFILQWLAGRALRLGWLSGLRVVIESPSRASRIDTRPCPDPHKHAAQEYDRSIFDLNP